MQPEDFNLKELILKESIKLLFEFLKFLLIQLYNWYKDRKKKRKKKLKCRLLKPESESGLKPLSFLISFFSLLKSVFSINL